MLSGFLWHRENYAWFVYDIFLPHQNNQKQHLLNCAMDFRCSCRKIISIEANNVGWNTLWLPNFDTRVDSLCHRSMVYDIVVNASGIVNEFTDSEKVPLHSISIVVGQCTLKIRILKLWINNFVFDSLTRVSCTKGQAKFNFFVLHIRKRFFLSLLHLNSWYIY